MYASDKGSGAAAMPANIGDGVTHARRAHDKLVTAGRSVALSGQHSELVPPWPYQFAHQTSQRLAPHLGRLGQAGPGPVATGETVRKRPDQWWDELTAQQAHIGRLASEGQTNAEIGAQLFLSPRTIEWHLGQLFTKLGISSRRELRRALAATGRLAVPT
jgi:DNA-binding CsgD family transcriptional regulator